MSANLFHPEEGPRKVIGGTVMVEGPEKPVMMQMFIAPSGRVYAEPVTPAPIDQLGGRDSVPVQNRHQGVDQI